MNPGRHPVRMEIADVEQARCDCRQANKNKPGKVQIENPLAVNDQSAIGLLKFAIIQCVVLDS